MMEEWYAANEKIFPTSIALNNYRNFDYYMKNLCREKEVNGIVPETTYFCLDLDRNIFVGAVTIRHYLTEKLTLNGDILVTVSDRVNTERVCNCNAS